MIAKDLLIAVAIGLAVFGAISLVPLMDLLVIGLIGLLAVGAIALAIELWREW